MFFFLVNKKKKKNKKNKKNKSKKKLAPARDSCLYSFVPPHTGTKENVGWCHCLSISSLKNSFMSAF